MDPETEVTRSEITTRAFANAARAAVIFGNDAVVTARPSTLAQLERACIAAGFDIVLPPAAGDELVAAAYLDKLAGCADHAVVACACPRVRSLLEQAPVPRFGACVAVASPPVAAARYLREVHGADLLITYVGDCPSAIDPAIDARFSAAGFLASLHRQGISVASQPNPTDHRSRTLGARYASTPGGLPARRFLARPPASRVMRDMDLETLRGALPSSRSKMVVDLGAAAGCSCADHPEEIAEYEPGRATAPVLAVPVGVDLSAEPSPTRSRVTLRARDGLAEPGGVVTGGAASPATPATIADTVSPRDVVGARPRDVVATAPRSGRPASPLPTSLTAMPRSRSATAPRDWPSDRRLMVLVALPVLVLALAAALGVAAYALGAAEAPGAPTRDSTGSAGGMALPTSAAAPGPLPDTSATKPAGIVPPPTGDSIRRNPIPSVPASDTGTRRRRQQPRAPEVIPGWLPQGQPTWNPDTLARRRPDSGSPPRRDSVPPA